MGKGMERRGHVHMLNTWPRFVSLAVDTYQGCDISLMSGGLSIETKADSTHYCLP